MKDAGVTLATFELSKRLTNSLVVIVTLAIWQFRAARGGHEGADAPEQGPQWDEVRTKLEVNANRPVVIALLSKV